MKRIYYFEDPIDYLTYRFKKRPIAERPTVSDIYEFCKAQYVALDQNKVREDMEAENTHRKELKIKANKAVDPEKATKQRKEASQKALKGKLEQDKFLKEHDPLAYQEKINSQWSEERRQKSAEIMEAIPKESKSKNGHRLKEVLTTEDRKRMAKNANKTKKSKKDLIVKEIYDTIQTNDWFLISDVGPICEKLGYINHRNYRNLQIAIENSSFGKDFFEVKVINMKPSKKKFFRKIETV